MAADDMKKVRIFVVGDPGVGKTTLIQLLCHNKLLSNPSSTIGCALEVKLHDYSKYQGHSQAFFVEFWDIGGSPNYRNGRTVFYNQIHGIILVHDLTNKKSYENLRKTWLPEVLAQGKRNSVPSTQFTKLEGEFDPEQFVGQNVPVLIVGMKQDLLSSITTRGERQSNSSNDMINVDGKQINEFAIGSAKMIKMNNFLDKVIEQKYFPKPVQAPTSSSERRRVSKQAVHLQPQSPPQSPTSN